MSESTRSSRRRRPTASGKNQKLPARLLAVMVLIIVLIYGLIFLTGDHTAKPRLGIDLQGGTRVTLVPQGGEPTPEQLTQARNILERRVNGMGVSGADVVVDGNTLVITVAGADTSEARSVGQTSQLLFRPVAVTALTDNTNYPTVLGQMANRWVENGVLTPDEANSRVKASIDFLNEQSDDKKAELKAPAVTAKAPAEPANSLEEKKAREARLEVLLKDRQSEDRLVQEAAGALLVCDGSSDPLAGADDPAKPLVTCVSGKGIPLILEPSPVLIGDENKGADARRLTGEQIDTGSPISGGFNNETAEMEVSFKFKSGQNEPGGSTWAKLTEDYLGKQVAVTLDSQIISAPEIESVTPVGSGTRITGDFTQEQAQELANNLKYGALPISFAGENGEVGGTAQTVPPSLGSASLKAGLIAGLVGLLLVTVFVLWYYRLLGFVSLITLVAAAVLVYGSLVLLGRWIGYSLDLSGIAGLIIGIGTTADSFVVIYERIKDEIRKGRTFRSATPHGWQRAMKTIVTGNMVTLIASVVIYILAVGEVKGFAFTLGLTTLFDFCVTFLVTAPLLLIVSRIPMFAKPQFNGMGRAMDFARRHAHSSDNDVAKEAK